MDELSNVYIEDLSYSKTEINAFLLAEQIRVDNELLNKVETVTVGSPTGTATLDQDGKHSLHEIPISNITETMDENETTKVMSPQRVHYAIGQRTIAKDLIGSALGVCPLDENIKVDPVYLPPAQIVNTFVVGTLVERNALSGVFEGDRCIVTADPGDVDGDINGEYVSEIDYPVPTDWTLLPNLSAVNSVNGQTGAVVISSVDESASNLASINAHDVRIGQLETDTPLVEARVAQNETDIQTNAANIADVDADILINEANITTNAADIGILNDEQIVQDARLDLLEALGLFAPVFKYSAVKDITVVGDTYEEVNTLPIDVVAGIYEFKVSMIYTLDSTTTSAYFRCSPDNGVTWQEFRFEPKDNTDLMCEYHTEVMDYPGGATTLIVQARKENANDILDIPSLYLIVERKE